MPSFVVKVNYQSFEAQVVMHDAGNLFCVLVFRPPKYNKDLIQQFSEFLLHIVPSCDNNLILGYFNIHVCVQISQWFRSFYSWWTLFTIVQILRNLFQIQPMSKAIFWIWSYL